MAENDTPIKSALVTLLAACQRLPMMFPEDFAAAIDQAEQAINQSSTDLLDQVGRRARTLADYRPQHDEDCPTHRCRRRKEHRGGCDCYFGRWIPGDCTCGLDALLAAVSGDGEPVGQDSEDSPTCGNCDTPREIAYTTDDDVDLCAQCYEELREDMLVRKLQPIAAVSGEDKDQEDHARSDQSGNSESLTNAATTEKGEVSVSTVGAQRKDHPNKLATSPDPGAVEQAKQALRDLANVKSVEEANAFDDCLDILAAEARGAAQGKEHDHGAELIHQPIPDMAGTEPRLNSEYDKSRAYLDDRPRVMRTIAEVTGTEQVAPFCQFPHCACGYSSPLCASYNTRRI